MFELIPGDDAPIGIARRDIKEGEELLISIDPITGFWRCEAIYFIEPYGFIPRDCVGINDNEK